jgi:2-hydroxycyclohexanecarboxyl-CoA dehydrogenase
MNRFDNQVVLVTGVGGATARRFAAEGAKVAVCDRDLAGAERTVAAITAAGGQALAVRCDITVRAEVDAGVAQVVQTLGPIDVLVNNAGWDIFAPFLKTTPDQWERLIAINLTGALHMHHAVLPGMVERRAGRVVNVAVDAACKGGLVSLSKTLAREHARHGITVNVVCPGPTDTALFADYKQGAGNPEKLEEAFRRSIPLGRIGQPDDLPGAVLFFASADAGYVTGQVLSVSGGLTMNG